MPGFDELDARIATYELSYRMQSAALEAGGMDQETRGTQRLYGLDQKGRADSALRPQMPARSAARRAAECALCSSTTCPTKTAGTLTPTCMAIMPRGRWTDQPIAALLTDLKQRGLLDSTLVICGSEFGRTPMMQGNNGRQHNAAGFTIWLAGGGVRAGRGSARPTKSA